MTCWLSGERSLPFGLLVVNHDIIFLSESWTGENSDIELSQYKCNNFYRKFQHRHAKRNSGGIVLYNKQELYSGMTIVRIHYETIIWLKLSKEFFKLDSDVNLCGVYMWCEDSPAYNVINTDLHQL